MSDGGQQIDTRTAFAKGYIEQLKSVLDAMPWNELSSVIKALEKAHAEDRQVFIAGNGGSAATSSHMACDLMLTTPKTGGKGFRVIALTDNVAAITAAGNDESYANVFVAQMRTLANEGDLIILISGSGNSENAIRAAKFAKQRGLKIFGFLGMGGGALAPLCDGAVIVPSNDYGPIEDAHMIFDHLITAYFHKWLNPNNA
ncbi:MAG: SIS domain-containing protein [Deltaproteobacteria bacterium]|nr:SIS domain-containing protein [Deltaproteobacteria bacterium]